MILGFNKLRYLFIFIIMAITPLRSQTQDVKPPLDRQAIGETLKQLWDSLDTVEFWCDCFPLDEAGQPDRSGIVVRHEFARQAGGCWALTVTAIKPNGEVTVMESFREDRRRRYTTYYFSGQPDSISHVVIQSQKSTSNSYEGMMFCMTWLLMPGHRPIHELLAEAGPLELEQTGRNERGLVTFVATYNGYPLRCTLDPDRDWLAYRVKLGDDQLQSYWQVDRFERNNGRWFPAEGTFLAHTTDGRKLWGFTVTNVSINQPLKIPSFGLPPLPEGTLVLDEVARTQTVIGGKAARERLEKLHRKPGDPVKREPGPPITASRDPERTSWAHIAVGISIAAFVVAGLWWARARVT